MSAEVVETRLRVCLCRNVPGSSTPAGTQLAIDGQTLHAVL